MPSPSPATLAVTALLGLAVAAGLAFKPMPPADSRADTNTPGLIDHTLIYQDAEGIEHALFFGRFGNFDWYFPCEFESGTWTLDADRTLHLNYDNPQYTPRTFRMAGLGDVLILTSPDGGGPSDAELIRGNKLPFG